MNWASSKKVIETYTLLETDKTNPIMSALIRDQRLNGMFHKVDDRVVLEAFARSCVLIADVNSILQKLFLNSEFLCFSMSQVGVSCAYDDNQRKYEIDRADKAAWIQAATAKPIGEGVWHKRFGSTKNYAPKFSPLPFNVFKGEDQYVYFCNGVITAVYISACVFNGTTLRTVRIYKVEAETPTTSKVTMYFGGLFTDTVDPKQISRAAEGVRQQTFSECSPIGGTWAWCEHATHFLKAQP
jgi:hypothetical protein